jgi:hypothetical protein
LPGLCSWSAFLLITPSLLVPLKGHFLFPSHPSGSMSGLCLLPGPFLIPSQSCSHVWLDLDSTVLSSSLKGHSFLFSVSQPSCPVYDPQYGAAYWLGLSPPQSSVLVEQFPFA